MRLSRQRHRARLRAALLASSALIAAPAAAQDATWNLNPATADWNTAGNWTPAAVPTGIATFGNSNATTIGFSQQVTSIGTMQFNAGAPSYRFQLFPVCPPGICGSTILNVTGTGVVNNSANTHTIQVNNTTLNFLNSSTAANTNLPLTSGILNFNNSSNAGTAVITMPNSMLPGNITFSNMASASNANITNVGIPLLGAGVFFLNASTAGNATIVNNPNTAVVGDGGILVFGDFVGGPHTADAGTAKITNNQFGTTSFLSQTSAANATIINNNGGGTNFQESSTAANANITNNAGAFLFFGDQSTAANATIANHGTMTFGFNFGFGDTATAGNAAITTHNGGRVEFFDNTTGGDARFITNAGGTFDMSGLSAAGMTAGSIEGAGDYVLGSKALTVGSNNLSTEVSGVISGIGGSLTKIGTGTLILSGINTYTGGTFNCACSTIQLGTLASMGAIRGAVTNEGMFNIVNADTSLITSITNRFGGETHFFNATSASGAVIVNNNGFTAFHDMSTAGTADITNRNGGETAFFNNSTAFHATITNRFSGVTSFFHTSTAAFADITNNGGATLFFDQTTAGNATITNRNGGATVFGDIAGTDTATAGNARITNRETGGETIFQALTTAGTATIINNGGMTSFFEKSNADAANITNRNGGLTVFADEASAANAIIVNRDGFFFFPSQTVFAGMSTAENANVTNQSFGATLFVDNANAGNATIVNNTDGATVFGTPFFTDAPSAGNANIVNNAGGMTFFQAFSTAGNATITTNNGGVTAFADNATGGNGQFITNAGGIVDFSQTLGPAGNGKITAGSIAGAGDYYLGGIELTVGGNNLSTEVSGTVNDGLSPFTCGCGIPGSGASLVKVGTGTLILSGVNTYTGPTTVNEGMLAIAPTGSITSNVTNNAFFFNAGTVTGNLFNNFGMAGNTGMIVGAATVNGGFVGNDGTITGLVTVNAGGTLGGNGTVGGATINGGGNLSPGHSIGTITVNGNLNFVGPGNYLVEVSPAAADRVNVTGAAALGGTLHAFAAGTGYKIGTTYTVINATGGVTGTFGNLDIVGHFGATKPRLEYDANNVFLVLGANAISPLLAGGTPNQRAVAGAVDAALQAGNQLAPFDVLFNLTPASLPLALDALSGEVHASTAGVLVDESLYVRSAVLGRLRQASYGGDASMGALSAGGPQLALQNDALATLLAYGGKSSLPEKAPLTAPAPSRDIAFWAQGFGAWGRLDGDGNAVGVRRDLAGFFTGVDARFGAWRGGVAAGYTASRNNLDGRGSANVETGHLAAYGGWSFGALRLRGGGAYAWHTIDTDRTIALPGFFDRATGHYNSGTGQIFGEAGYGFAFGRVAVEPFAGGACVHLSTDAFNERGGAAALRAAANSFDIGYSTLGIRAASMIPLWSDMILVPRASASWQHAFGDVTPAATLAFQGAGAPFVIAGVPIARDSLLSEAGLDLAIGRHATLGVAYSGQLARHVQDHAAKGKFSWKF